MKATERIHFINFNRKLTINTIQFLIPLYFLKIGLQGWQIGIIVSLFAFAPLIFSFPTGWINDRLAIRYVIFIALAALSVLLLLVAGVRSFPALALLFLGIGISSNALEVSMNSLYFKDETEIDPNRKYGIYIFWNSLGPALGILFGGYLIYYRDFRILLVIFAAILALMLTAVRGFDHEKLAVVSIRDYHRSLWNRRTLLFAVMLFVLALHWGLEGTVYTPFLKTRFGLDSRQMALYISIPTLFLALTAFLVGRLKYDPKLNRRLFFLFMFLSGAGLVLMTAGDVYMSFFFRLVHEIGDGGLGALTFLFISKLFERRSIGGSAGILLAVQTLGHSLGAIIFSNLGYGAGLQYPFYAAGILLVANSIFSRFVFQIGGHNT